MPSSACKKRRQNVGYSNFSQPQSHLSFCVLLQYLVEQFLFFNDTATTEIYTLSLHDALPIYPVCGLLPSRQPHHHHAGRHRTKILREPRAGDRKSTRLNSSHANISYAVFCLQKKTPKRRLQ